MSSVRHTQTPTELDLSMDEAWLVHHVMVEQLTGGTSDEPQPWWALDIARKLERDDAALTPFEAWRLRSDLLDYAERETTATSDVALAHSVVSRLETRFGRPPLS
ncbi:hypothetical protein [Haloarchaeobius sp. HRN-SO-5]|uniref:DUF7853 family protein n=1 Tax=Haloarchaeobius sp. HRN-SO-5 TaxID=3446118 RepID=UPI003EB9AB54